jgi:hypothetical protein
MWADDDNAVTRAEAQAKKRAASMFGLGEYFYELKSLGTDLWVPLDERGNPTRLPKLPPWALPVEMRQAVGPTKTAAQPAAQQRSAQQPPQQQGGQQQTGASVQRQRSAPQGEVQNPQQKRNRSAQLRPELVAGKSQLVAVRNHSDMEEVWDAEFQAVYADDNLSALDHFLSYVWGKFSQDASDFLVSIGHKHEGGDWMSYAGNLDNPEHIGTLLSLTRIRKGL